MRALGKHARRSPWPVLAGLWLWLPCVAGAALAAQPAAPAGEILWDRYGVPHVYGEDVRGLFHGFGWAQAHSHGDAVLRVAGLDRPGLPQQYWDMATARDFAGLQAALQQRLQVPMFNIVYGDRAGNILYLHNGILPKHDGGDLAFWRSPVAGDTSATPWDAVHSYEELPKVLNPSSGFVQNTNDPPWLVTWPLRFVRWAC
ncbi:MAG: penicillin acylase family protein [Pseudomonas sp.]